MHVCVRGNAYVVTGTRFLQGLLRPEDPGPKTQGGVPPPPVPGDLVNAQRNVQLAKRDSNMHGRVSGAGVPTGAVVGLDAGTGMGQDVSLDGDEEAVRQAYRRASEALRQLKRSKNIRSPLTMRAACSGAVLPAVVTDRYSGVAARPAGTDAPSLHVQAQTVGGRDAGERVGERGGRSRQDGTMNVHTPLGGNTRVVAANVDRNSRCQLPVNVLDADIAAPALAPDGMGGLVGNARSQDRFDVNACCGDLWVPSGRRSVVKMGRCEYSSFALVSMDDVGAEREEGDYDISESEWRFIIDRQTGIIFIGLLEEKFMPRDGLARRFLHPPPSPQHTHSTHTKYNATQAGDACLDAGKLRLCLSYRWP